MPAAAVVLAGGRSRRMGRDKATIRLGGRRLVDRAAEALGALFAEVWVSTGSRRLRLPRGTKGVPDLVPGAGPLAGIHAALRATRRRLLFVAACDAPRVDARAARLLWRAARSGRGAVPEGPGGPEPLFAFYARSLLPEIERRLRAGTASVRALARLRGVRRVPWGSLREAGVDAAAFRSLNRPADLRRARALLRKGGKDTVARMRDAGRRRIQR